MTTAAATLDRSLCLFEGALCLQFRIRRPEERRQVRVPRHVLRRTFGGFDARALRDIGLEPHVDLPQPVPPGIIRFL